MKREAIFSSGTENFITPMSPNPGDMVTFRCRVGHRDPVQVFLVTSENQYIMSKSFETTGGDYYQVNIQIGNTPFYYHFKIVEGEEVVYYNKKGDQDHVDTSMDYEVMPGFHVPEWAKGAVYYQIFPDRFYNGNKKNRVKTGEYSYISQHVTEVEDWNALPENMDVRRFYGGDLQGIWDKLDYLQDLGVEVLYLNPIFVSPSNHKYDVQDYDYIDPHLTVLAKEEGECLDVGDIDNTHASRYRSIVTDPENLQASNEFFIRFVEEIHRRGMRIILDGVFNHCGSFHPWMDREGIYQGVPGRAEGAYFTENSPYKNYFTFLPGGHWPNNFLYDGWWGNDTLPKLNYEGSKALEQEILRIAKKWVSPPYNVDGWRLDVAADIGHSEEYNHSFFKKFREVVKKANPEAVILAEHYGNAKAWLKGDQWDTVMNYDGFMEPVSWFLTGMNKHSDAKKPELRGNNHYFYERMTEANGRFHMQEYLVAMNELSNHDHSRFLTRTNRKVGRLASAGSREAETGLHYSDFYAGVVIQMTWPGAPTVYYGDEAGVCGWTDPDSRRTYPWGREDKDLLQFHKEIIRIHKDYRALREGALIYLISETNLLGYARFLEKESVIVLVYIGEEERQVTVEAYRAEVPDGAWMVSLMRTDESGFDLEAQRVMVENGTFQVTMKPNSAMILKNMDRPY